MMASCLTDALPASCNDDTSAGMASESKPGLKSPASGLQSGASQGIIRISMRAEISRYGVCGFPRLRGSGLAVGVDGNGSASITYSRGPINGSMARSARRTTPNLLLTSGPMSENKQRLLELLKERSLQLGLFRLASGGTSDYYIDGKMTTVYSEAAYLIGEVLYEWTKDLDIDAIGGLEVGAVPLTTAAVISYHRCGRPMEGFWVRDKVKGQRSRHSEASRGQTPEGGPSRHRGRRVHQGPVGPEGG